ncbi:hypothetical protein [Clostridium sp. HMP27]|uniref:hypothetical protein n=1 Tax=Clostridium sp. HMP27 TaxID=1487921 RepID=UPI000AB2E722|nr:hypothetical protein [Clostridium sp. HMP27]
MLDILKDIMKILLIFIGGLFLLYLLTSFIELFPKDIQKIVFLIMLIVYLMIKRRYKKL